jgi:hypothetical protein
MAGNPTNSKFNSQEQIIPEMGWQVLVPVFINTWHNWATQIQKELGKPEMVRPQKRQHHFTTCVII